ncbi:MAG: HAD-IA family hydrolase [Myxococcota bacterium]|nr:HAD-IA family hydrolase [Myxococcota bacterium]
MADTSLLTRRHWIFDMDGTLTHAAHDFAAFKAKYDLPPDRPILEYLRELPEDEAAQLNKRLNRWEEKLARKATAADDAVRLLSYLDEQHYRLGILTRNSSKVASMTLQAAGLARFFNPRFVLGRDNAAPKPSPEGIQKILTSWRAEPSDTVMVGDFQFDLEAGAAAGTATVLIDRLGGRDWPCDVRVARLDALLPSSRW